MPHKIHGGRNLLLHPKKLPMLPYKITGEKTPNRNYYRDAGFFSRSKKLPEFLQILVIINTPGKPCWGLVGLSWDLKGENQLWVAISKECKVWLKIIPKMSLLRMKTMPEFFLINTRTTLKHSREFMVDSLTFFCTEILIPDGLEWNGQTEGFFVEWLSYFVFPPEKKVRSLFCQGSIWFSYI